MKSAFFACLRWFRQWLDGHVAFAGLSLMIAFLVAIPILIMVVSLGDMHIVMKIIIRIGTTAFCIWFSKYCVILLRAVVEADSAKPTPDTP
ncbi:hypothetical protein HN481_01380 [Candidatus Parcubacteria bacterium]|nr:hypothetical protein [Candidatus Parcubacteria bacterium]